MSALNLLRLISYNCRGWNSGHLAVNDLLKTCDICLIQEHWLQHVQLNLNVNIYFMSVGISGMDSSRLLLGRPFGGCAILFRKSLCSHISCLDSVSKRFCSIPIHDHQGSSTLLVCVYLPSNDESADYHTDFLITLGELEGFIDRHKTDHIVIAGDFNVDFHRDSVNARHLHIFMTDLGLVSADLPFCSSVQYTYMRDDGCVSSWPDHFLCDRQLAGQLSCISRVDFGSNLSDHSPLACSLNLDLSHNLSNPPLTPCLSNIRIAWHKATPDDIST